MSEPDPEPRPPIAISPWSRLGLAALVGALVSRTGVLAVTRVVGSPPTIPWGIAVIVWLLTLTVAELARSTRRRIHQDSRWMAAARGVRLLAIGKAAAWTGAFGVGMMAVYAVGFVGQLEVPLSARRALIGAVAAVGCALLAVAGRALQRSCRIPDDPDLEADQPENAA